MSTLREHFGLPRCREAGALVRVSLGARLAADAIPMPASPAEVNQAFYALLALRSYAYALKRKSDYRYFQWLIQLLREVK